MIYEHFSSFSSFMPIVALLEEVVRLFCALPGLIMSLHARTKNKTSLNSSGYFRISSKITRRSNLGLIFWGYIKNKI